MGQRGIGAGSRLGRYQLLRELGGGAGGRVFEASDTMLERRVAVKVLATSAKVAPDEAANRFLREARIASHIRHPHVVDVFDLGMEDGVAFLVMELVEGETLADLLDREQPLGLEDTLDIVLPVVSAVAELHSRHVVHRDIKPANILLPRSNRRSPKLTDFGISRFAYEGTAITRTGALVGTPAYLAPEVAGGGRAASEKSDQYSLAVILYECVTGQKPFRGMTDYELVHAIVTGEPLVPSAQAAWLSRAFDAVVLRGLHRDPCRRFDSVDEFGAALLPFASAAFRSIWTSQFSPPASVPSVEHPRSHRVPITPTGERTVADPTSGTTPAPRSSSMPRASTIPSSRSSAPPPPALADEGRPRVLVVDDDELNLRTFRRVFRGDFDITCADSGARALEHLAGAVCDVALVDYAMPGMNGVQFLRASRIRYPDVKAVMVTAHADLEEVRAAIVEGLVHAIIMKPYDRQTILRWVLHCHRVGAMRRTVDVMRANVDESGRR